MANGREQSAGETLMNRLIETYGDSLLRMCYLYLKDRDLAQDAVQETLIKAYYAYADFRGESAEKTWLLRIAINTCKNHLRSPWSRLVNRSAALDQLEDSRKQEYEPADDAVVQAVMCLPTKDREIILLRYYQQLRVKEIAIMLHKPESTIAARLKRARDRLRLNLEGRNGEG
jgi:RNA polymerase sigma-70 factor (ECF subfamily)